MKIARAKPEDAPRLTALAVAAKGHWGYPPHWMALWQDALTVTPAFIQEADVYVALDGEEIVGFCALAQGAGITTLEHCWVRPDAMGRGVGRALFMCALRCAAEQGFAALEIESDPFAEGFYLRMGAERIGERTYELEGRPRVLPLLVYAVQ